MMLVLDKNDFYLFFLNLTTRDQAKKATEMHPKMTAEAERMLTKLRVSTFTFYSTLDIEM